ncbi:hypothetical protein V8E54_011743 [Elaphomyces granulatus]
MIPSQKASAKRLEYNLASDAPNFGPYELGTVVGNIKDFRPINDDDRVPIIKKHSDVKKGITANVLNSSVGDESLKCQKSDDDVYHIEKLETVYFFPNRKYLSDCVKRPDVKDYLEGGNYRLPVYLITGLKIAWGTTYMYNIEMTRGREIDANAKIDAPADFVLGIQTMKLYHRKPSPKSKPKYQCIIFDDDDDVEDSEDEEDKFVIADLDDGDMQGLEYKVETGVDGKDVVWIIPSDTV